MHIDDLTGLSLEVLLFVEIAVRSPFEGLVSATALHSTGGFGAFSLEHDDEQRSFVHLTFVHARHGRPSPCSCTKALRSWVVERARRCGKRGQKKRGCYRGTALLGREGGQEQVPVSTEAQPWSHLLQLRVLGIPRDRSLGTPVIGQTAFLCVALHHTPS